MSEKTKNRKVWIQQLCGAWCDDWAYAASVGFASLGFEVKTFEDWEEIASPGPNCDVVVGFVEDTKRYLVDHGMQVPKPLNIPRELMHLISDRRLDIMTMKEFLESSEPPVFVKPYQEVKAHFPSGVVYSKDNYGLHFAHVPDDFLVMTSSVIDPLSEYRCFVSKGELVGVKHYSGDFRLFPDLSPVHDVLDDKDWASVAPAAYTVDIAVIDYKTTIIELQDMWSIGHYGLDPVLYAKLLRDRWYQITKI